MGVILRVGCRTSTGTASGIERSFFRQEGSARRTARAFTRARRPPVIAGAKPELTRGPRSKRKVPVAPTTTVRVLVPPLHLPTTRLRTRPRTSTPFLSTTSSQAASTLVAVASNSAAAYLPSGQARSATSGLLATWPRIAALPTKSCTRASRTLPRTRTCTSPRQSRLGTTELAQPLA